MIDYVLNFATIFPDYKVKGYPKFSNITKLCCHIYLIQYLIPKPNKKNGKLHFFTLNFLPIHTMPPPKLSICPIDTLI